MLASRTNVNIIKVIIKAAIRKYLEDGINSSDIVWQTLRLMYTANKWSCHIWWLFPSLKRNYSHSWGIFSVETARSLMFVSVIFVNVKCGERNTRWRLHWWWKFVLDVWNEQQVLSTPSLWLHCEPNDPGHECCSSFIKVSLDVDEIIPTAAPKVRASDWIYVTDWDI